MLLFHCSPVSIQYRYISVFVRLYYIFHPDLGYRLSNLYIRQHYFESTTLIAYHLRHYPQEPKKKAYNSAICSSHQVQPVGWLGSSFVCTSLPYPPFLTNFDMAVITDLVGRTPRCFKTTVITWNCCDCRTNNDARYHPNICSRLRCGHWRCSACIETVYVYC
jgi:hypothetical protein